MPQLLHLKTITAFVTKAMDEPQVHLSVNERQLLTSVVQLVKVLWGIKDSLYDSEEQQAEYFKK